MHRHFRHLLSPLAQTQTHRQHLLHQQRTPESDLAHRTIHPMLRVWIYKQAPWGDSLAHLKKVWSCMDS